MQSKRLFFISIAKAANSAPKFLFKSCVFSNKGWQKFDHSFHLPLEV
jgi:hypothetical protein